MSDKLVDIRKVNFCCSCKCVYIEGLFAALSRFLFTVELFDEKTIVSIDVKKTSVNRIIGRESKK